VAVATDHVETERHGSSFPKVEANHGTICSIFSAGDGRQWPVGNRANGMGSRNGLVFL
jgi:hypothetical protein